MHYTPKTVNPQESVFNKKCQWIMIKLGKLDRNSKIGVYKQK